MHLLIFDFEKFLVRIADFNVYPSSVHLLDYLRQSNLAQLFYKVNALYFLRYSATCRIHKTTPCPSRGRRVTLNNVIYVMRPQGRNHRSVLGVETPHRNTRL